MRCRLRWQAARAKELEQERLRSAAEAIARQSICMGFYYGDDLCVDVWRTISAYDPMYIDRMKKTFPLGIIGYPWSKLVTELALYEAQRNAGLPVAIFRLPQIATNVATGYTQGSDITVRVMQAILQTGIVPGNFCVETAVECAGAVCELGLWLCALRATAPTLVSTR